MPFIKKEWHVNDYTMLKYAKVRYPSIGGDPAVSCGILFYVVHNQTDPVVESFPSHTHFLVLLAHRITISEILPRD